MTDNVNQPKWDSELLKKLAEDELRKKPSANLLEEIVLREFKIIRELRDAKRSCEVIAEILTRSAGVSERFSVESVRYYIRKHTQSSVKNDAKNAAKRKAAAEKKAAEEAAKTQAPIPLPPEEKTIPGGAK